MIATNMVFTPKSTLPRLSREFYRGHAMVLWTHTFENRATGWLNVAFHHRFREILLHACARYAVASPCYVLMPDHWHLVWLGISPGSDQSLATAFLRKNLRSALGNASLQDRAHDRVLREKDRERAAFQDACSYVRRNPQRAGLCADWREWPYAGAMIAGYPDLDPRKESFWEDFWKIHNRLVSADDAVPALSIDRLRTLSEVERPRRATSVKTPIQNTDSNPCAPAQGYKKQAAVARPGRGGTEH